MLTPTIPRRILLKKLTKAAQALVKQGEWEDTTFVGPFAVTVCLTDFLACIVWVGRWELLSIRGVGHHSWEEFGDDSNACVATCVREGLEKLILKLESGEECTIVPLNEYREACLQLGIMPAPEMLAQML